MTQYDAVGGHDALLAITRRFYASALEDELLGDMFSRVDPHHADYLADWMSVVFGGPRDYLRTRGDVRFVTYQHMNLKITEAQRARWERLMLDAAAQQDPPDSFMRAFSNFTSIITRSVRENSHLPPDMLRRSLGLQPGEELLPLLPESSDGAS